jgi:hypothetical protein
MTLERVDLVLQRAITDAQEASERAQAERGQELRRESIAAAMDRRRALLSLATPSLEPRILDALVRDEELLDTEPMLAMRAWYEDRRAGRHAARWLFLLGGPGIGKDVAVAWLMAREEAVHLVAEDLVGLYRRDDKRWDRARRAHLLAIEDIGTEVDADMARAVFFACMNGRVGEGWTVITSNMTAAQLDAWLDERMGSRMARYASVIECRGEDLRRKLGPA